MARAPAVGLFQCTLRRSRQLSHTYLGVRIAAHVAETLLQLPFIPHNLIGYKQTDASGNDRNTGAQTTRNAEFPDTSGPQC